MKQVNVKTEKKLLDSNLIKIIAILAMTVDHIAWAVFPGYPQEWLPVLMHLVGRITCPIMCYFIAEGYHYTRNIRKYMLRLFAFALLSHFCYLYASTDFAGLKSFLPFASGKMLNQTSVMWSLAWGLVMLQVANSARIKNSVLRIILILLICLVSFPSDWSCIAALCILSFGTNRGNFKAQSFWLIFYVGIYAIVYFFAIDKLYGILQMGVVLSLPLLRLYNGQRGKNQSLNRFMKWFFYLYYPLHLLIIGLILHPLFPAQRDGIEVSGVSAIEETSIPEDATKMAYIIDMTETSVTIDEIEWITLDMTWEDGVLEEEQSQADYVCWLRNPPRKPWSLCIPYEMGGEQKPAYPDFIIIRKEGEDDFVIDILEPHDPTRIDNLGKVKGFAEYARQNPGVGRIQLIRKGKDAAGHDRFKRLDMAKSAVRDKVSRAMTNDELDHIFDTDGFFM